MRIADSLLFFSHGIQSGDLGGSILSYHFIIIFYLFSLFPLFPMFLQVTFGFAGASSLQSVMTDPLPIPHLPTEFAF